MLDDDERGLWVAGRWASELSDVDLETELKAQGERLARSYSNVSMYINALGTWMEPRGEMAAEAFEREMLGALLGDEFREGHAEILEHYRALHRAVVRRKCAAAGLDYGDVEARLQFWTTARFDVVRIAELSDQHLHNCIQMLRRWYGNIVRDTIESATPSGGCSWAEAQAVIIPGARHIRRVPQAAGHGGREL